MMNFIDIRFPHDSENIENGIRFMRFYIGMKTTNVTSQSARKKDTIRL